MTGGKQNRVLFVCVNYRNDEETAAFAGRVAALQEAHRVRVVIVDNSAPATGSGLAERLAGQPHVHVVPAPDNPGYFGGAERGLRAFLEIEPLPEWTVVTNTDILFPDADLLARLEARHAASPPAVVAPRICSARTGLDQNPFARSRPSRTQILYWNLAFTCRLTFVAHHLASAAWRRLRQQRSRLAEMPEPTRIFAPHGAFVIFHRSYFLGGGGLATGTHLFCEELYVGEVARRLGLRVIYDPSIRVVHAEHATIARLSGRRRFQAVRQANRRMLDVFSPSFDPRNSQPAAPARTAEGAT